MIFYEKTFRWVAGKWTPGLESPFLAGNIGRIYAWTASLACWKLVCQVSGPASPHKPTSGISIPGEENWGP